MFCPECGFDCKDANFCPNCGAVLRKPVGEIPPLKEPYHVLVNGHDIDLNSVVRIYGMGARKAGAYAFLQNTCKINKQEAKEILDPIYAAHAQETISFATSLMASVEAHGQPRQAKKNNRKQRIADLEASGKVYCPKCLSTEVTAQKKGFGFVRGALGVAVGVDVGMIAGGIGSKKIVLTCLKCGYQWKPGKK